MLLIPKAGERLKACPKPATHTLQCYGDPEPFCAEHIVFYQDTPAWQDAVRRGTAKILPIKGAIQERQLSLWQ